MENKMLLLASFVVVFAVVSAQKPFPTDCDSCDESKCPAADKCLAGTTHDRCGCCLVCAKAEYEMCDHSKIKARGDYGPCGKNLECRVREDLLSDEVPEALCYCVYDRVLCGSDGQTYENQCELDAAAVSKGINIDVQSEGPCRSVPAITLPPEHVKNKTGSNVFMACEARGVPIPAVEWTWTRVDGKTVFLPSDDLHMSVNVRGGPEKWQVTSWLQIMDLKKTHEGDYTCLAQNELGSSEASARVIVIGGQDENKHRSRDNDIL